MATISGDLKLVTAKPALVSEVLVRAPRPRASGTGLIVEAADPVKVAGGRVSFSCEPGPAVLQLVEAGRVTRSIPIFVGAGASQTLAQVVQAAMLLEGEHESELARLVDKVTSAAARAAVARDQAVAATAGKADRQHRHVSADITDATALAGGVSSMIGDRLVKTRPDGRLFIATDSITEAGHAANKAYVDAVDSRKAERSHSHVSADITDAVTGGGMGRPGGAVVKTYSDGMLHSVSDPTDVNHVARKAWVDAQVSAARAFAGSRPANTVTVATEAERSRLSGLRVGDYVYVIESGKTYREV